MKCSHQKPEKKLNNRSSPSIFVLVIKNLIGDAALNLITYNFMNYERSQNDTKLDCKL